MTLLRPRSHYSPCASFQPEDTCMPIRYVRGDAVALIRLWTCLNDMVYRVRGDRSDEVVYSRYCIAAISGHIYNDSLWDISKRVTAGRKNTDLYKKKKADVR